MWNEYEKYFVWDNEEQEPATVFVPIGQTTTKRNYNHRLGNTALSKQDEQTLQTSMYGSGLVLFYSNITFFSNNFTLDTLTKNTFLLGGRRVCLE